MSFSKIIAKDVDTEIGLKFLGVVRLFPFFGIGVTNDVLKSLGV